MNFYCKFVNLLVLPIFLKPFFEKKVGREYGVGIFSKIKLLFDIHKIIKGIHTASSWHEHVLMAKAILQLPSSLKGVVVECGCFKGGSAASLSLVCSLTGRKLVVFDSFQGLPEPERTDRVHHCPYVNIDPTYSKGDYKASLEEVKKNIKRYGCLDVCEFVEGYFKNTMPEFIKKFNDKIVFIFLDVDLRKSLETCIFYLWPFLQNGCKLFTHEAPHLEISSFFFDREWWASHFNSSIPGLIGSGNGLSYNTRFWSPLGYTIKSENLYNDKHR